MDDKEETLLTKKGTVRRRKPKQSREYFTKDTEKAIMEFVITEDQDKRNRLYKNRIEFAFFKLTQNIIHTFKFYYTDGESIEDIQQDVVVFLLQQLKKFKPEKGAAYSYFGTIAKRYCIVKNKKNYKKLQERGELEEVDEDKSVYNEIVRENLDSCLNEFIHLFVKYMDKNLSKLFTKFQELNIAGSIIELFRKKESLEIFNKKALYIYIKEMTNAETNIITKIIKRIKVKYSELYNQYYKDGTIYI